MPAEVEGLLAVIKAFARQKSLDFQEWVDFCIYPEMVGEWLNSGLSTTAIKKQVEEKYALYNKQHKYLSSLA